MEGGNSYCSQVTKITYHNISQHGSYKSTTNMDVNSGICSHDNVTYPNTGTLTPLLGEVSMHLRGPMNLTQLAVYTLPNTVSGKRRSVSDHGHKGKGHRRKFAGIHPKIGSHDHHKRDVGDMVTATIDGQVVSWINVYDGTPATQETDKASLPTTEAALSSFGNSPVTTTDIQDIYVATTITEDTEAMSSAAITLTGQKPRTTVYVTTTEIITIPTGSAAVLSKAEATGVDATTYLLSADSSSSTSLSSVSATTTSENSAPTTLQSVFSAYSTSTNTDSEGGAAPTSPSSTGASNAPQPSTAVKAEAGSWSRVAYYQSAASAQATGFAFLNHRGNDAVSGTWDSSFGNSLSYASSDGTTCANVSTPFSGNLSTSDVELAVFTDQVCNGDCDYTRPKSVAHHGWSGEAKAFFVEFQMDHYNNSPSSNQGLIQDAPAWWFLNANIPRVLQYGDDRNSQPCSCWAYGCGEFDAFEILEQGEMRAKSTLHRQGNLEGGDSNYFLRPVGKTIKVAVVWKDYNITVAILDDSFSFSEVLTASQIADIVSYSEQSNTNSLFAIGT
ncbi:hypothetical protein BU16DRAFT_504893 [Lophium mytilinum]|uniref:glucan endo-1,3-beta-D-glucosidase n=1 Tax=Lophium mytilinum TaxID=390894 RepID=A0A6A6R1Y3_9PEZI|nr:hypothetical protein BU16DRAFT_504893 [Lophium mytilinum]